MKTGPISYEQGPVRLPMEGKAWPKELKPVRLFCSPWMVSASDSETSQIFPQWVWGLALLTRVAMWHLGYPYPAATLGHGEMVFEWAGGHHWPERAVPPLGFLELPLMMRHARTSDGDQRRGNWGWKGSGLELVLWNLSVLITDLEIIHGISGAGINCQLVCYGWTVWDENDHKLWASRSTM